jgi:hypothetical protein
MFMNIKVRYTFLICTIKNTVFQDMTLCSLVNVYQYFRGKSFLYLQCTRVNQYWKYMVQTRELVLCHVIMIDGDETHTYIHTPNYSMLRLFFYLDTKYNQFTDTLKGRLECVTSMMMKDDHNIYTSLLSVTPYLKIVIIYK